MGKRDRYLRALPAALPPVLAAPAAAAAAATMLVERRVRRLCVCRLRSSTEKPRTRAREWIQSTINPARRPSNWSGRWVDRPPRFRLYVVRMVGGVGSGSAAGVAWHPSIQTQEHTRSSLSIARGPLLRTVFRITLHNPPIPPNPTLPHQAKQRIMDAAAFEEAVLTLRSCVPASLDSSNALDPAAAASSQHSPSQQPPQPPHPPRCRPWSEADYFRRLRTFHPQTYFGKPLAAGPPRCAAHGWVNDGVDRLRCEGYGGCVWTGICRGMY